MMRAAFYTLGCKLNQCESEALATSFDSQGFLIGSYRDSSDIYVVNTCTVTSKAEQKARRMIRKLASEHPFSVVLVTGCYAQLNAEDLKLAPNVVVVPHDQKVRINELPGHLNDSGTGEGSKEMITQVQSFFGLVAEQAMRQESEDTPQRFWYDSVNFNFHTRAYLKIQDGCDNSCAYCRVPLARGKSISQDINLLCEQFKELQDKGYLEVILTGVNISSYKDKSGADFSDLLKRLCDIRDKARIRLSSIEPESITPGLAEVLKDPGICPHFHIPVQSGSDKILEVMKRKNRRSQIIEAVRLLREAKEDPFIAADIIAGFPGETDEDYRQSFSLLDDCDFSALHVFPYSSRPGTAASTMKNRVPERITSQRTAELRELSSRKTREYTERWMSRELEVLIEEKKDNCSYGISSNYLKTVFCDILKEEGSLCTVKPEPGLSSDKTAGSDTIPCRFIKWIV